MTLRFTVLGLALAALSACTTAEVQGFRLVKNSDIKASYVSLDADFSKYNRITADEMGIFFPSDAAPSIADQQQIREIFVEAFMDRLDGYEIVQGESGPTTLEVQASLIDFRGGTGGDVPMVRREIRDIAKPGSIVFLMELRDSVSGKVLARAADSAATPQIATSGAADTDWDSVADAAVHWSELFRQFLDESLGK